MWSAMLHTCHTRDANAKWVQTELDDAKVQRTRRLPNSSQVSERNQCHSNAVRAAHARGLRAALVEELTARIHQLLESIPSGLYRKLQVYIQVTRLTRGAA